MRRLARDHELTDNMTGRLDESYERTVADHTRRRQAAYEAALRYLEAAERKAERAARDKAAATTARDKKSTAKRYASAWALVELRREELETLSRVMKASPAGAAHRGTGSFRPVPIRHGGDL